MRIRNYSGFLENRSGLESSVSFLAELLLHKIKSTVYFDVMRLFAKCFKRSFIED